MSIKYDDQTFKDDVPDIMNVLFDRNTVTIDIGVSEEKIWKKQIRSKKRNMVGKAEKNNLEFRAE